MTTKKVVILALACGGISLFSAAEGRPLGGQPEFKQRVSHDALAKRQRPRDPKAEERKIPLEDLLRGGSPQQNAPHRKPGEKDSLVKRSAIISAGSNWTIVPKEAILHIPNNYKLRVNGKRHGKLIGWQKFFANNRNWIQTYSVTIEEARGDTPLSEERIKSLQRAGRLVVAICNGGPISVLPPKEPETLEAKTEGKVQPSPGKTRLSARASAIPKP